MPSVRVSLGCAVALVLLAGTDHVVGAKEVGAKEKARSLTASRLWTYGHVTPGQLSEIPAFDRRTNTIWVAGVVGVDVLDASTGTLVEHIDVTQHGAVNSVAIDHGLAAFAVEAASSSAACPSCDRRNPGKVLFYSTLTREPAEGVNDVSVGSLPDMLTFTHAGELLLVANEGTPNVAADLPYAAVDPPGSVSIIDVDTRTLVHTALLNGLPTSGANLRLPASTGMDFEPEYITVNNGNVSYHLPHQP